MGTLNRSGSRKSVVSEDRLRRDSISRPRSAVKHDGDNQKNEKTLLKRGSSKKLGESSSEVPVGTLNRSGSRKSVVSDSRPGDRPNSATNNEKTLLKRRSSRTLEERNSEVPVGTLNRSGSRKSVVSDSRPRGPTAVKLAPLDVNKIKKSSKKRNRSL